MKIVIIKKEREKERKKEKFKMLSLETRSEKENLIEDVSGNLIESGINGIKIPPFENVNV